MNTRLLISTLFFFTVLTVHTTTAQTINLRVVEAHVSIDNGELKKVNSAYQIDIKDNGVVQFWGVEVKGYIDFSTRETQWGEYGETVYYKGTIAIYGKSLDAMWFVNTELQNGIFGVVFTENGSTCLMMYEVY